MRRLIVAALAGTLAVSGANAAIPYYPKDTKGDYEIPQFEIEAMCAKFDNWASECLDRNQDGYSIAFVLWPFLTNDNRRDCIFMSKTNGSTVPYEVLGKCVIKYVRDIEANKPAPKFQK